MKAARRRVACHRDRIATPDRVLGSLLCPADQAMAKRLFVHRFTGEHTPNWATLPREDGRKYSVQFKDDADWLAHTWFEVDSSWRLASWSKQCESNPTWPNGLDEADQAFLRR